MRITVLVSLAVGAVLACGASAFGAPPAGIACTLAASPPVVEAGTEVTLTLRVIGADGAQKTSIDDRDLKSAVGGSSRFKVDKTKTFVGRVQKGKVTSTCSVEVKVGKVDPAVPVPEMIEPPT